MRASATSRIASPAVFPSPQSKSDANKADDTSPFAILLNEVVAKPAVPQKNTQNKDSQGSSENSDNDAGSQASGTDAATQTASQAVVTPPKSDKGSDKSAKNNGDTRNDNSASGRSAQANQQAGAQVPAPAQPSASQISVILAANAGGAAANDAANGDVTTDPADTAGIAAGAQNGAQANTPASQTGSSSQNMQSAGQAPTPQCVNTPAGQNSSTQAPTLNIPPPDVTQSPPIQPASPPAQAPAVAQNIVQPNPPQPVPVQPPPTQSQAPGPTLNSVRSDASQPPAAPPKGQKPQTSVAQNTVQSDADQLPAVRASGPQVQTSATQNTVQSNAAPSPSVQPAKTDKSNDKDAKNAGAKDGSGSASDTTAVSQAQPPVQPDASLITNVTANAAVTPADDDAGQDEPDIEAAGAAAIGANGSAQAQCPQSAQGAPGTNNLQALLSARQANLPQGTGQGAAPQTGAHGDSVKTQDPGANQSQPQQGQQDANLSIKPWQAKPQNGTGDVTANSSQTSNASPDDVKQAVPAAPQTAATGNMPMPKPADAGNNNLLVMPGATGQTQPGQANTAPVVTQNVQVSTSGPNMPALAVEIAARSQSGAKQFDIRLDPPELGRVEVRLSIDATGKASAHVSADQPQTLDLLQKDAPTLTRALRDAGLNVSQNGLNFSLRQQQGDAGASGNQGRGGNSRSFTLTANSSIDATQTGATYRGPADGRLDIRV